MDSRLYWEDNGPHVKYESYNSNDGFGRQGEGNLNFATGVLHSEDDGDYISTAYLKKGKVARQDPMSHRIIEKRRRDRMNNCLADLSRLIPPDYLKKGRGRVEKTEIIEMAIRHLKYLQDRTNDQQCEGPISAEHFRLGYQECRSEVMRYLVEGQGYLPTDSLCVQLVGHLHRHCDNIMKGDQLNKPRSNPETTSSSSGSSNNNYSGVVKQTVIAQAQRANPLEHNNNLDFRKRQHYEPQSYAPSPEPQDDYMPYQQCEPQPLTLARNSQSCEPTLRNIRKLEHSHVEEYADHIHSYKYKNTIKQRFSQDIAQDMSLRHGKRCRGSSKQASSISLTSNDEGVCQDASSEESPATDELRDIPPHLTPEPPPLPTLAQVSSDPPRESKLSTLCIPVFALNAHGKYYVPLNVNYECLASFLGPYDLLDGTNGSPISPLHPVSINVNFQPYLEHIKLKPESKQDWHPI